MYYGAYEGYLDGSKVRSISGKEPTRNISFSNFHTYCKANGTGYEMECFSKRWYLLGLLMLVCKGRDIQNSIGYGRCGSNSSPNSTGVLNNNRLFYGRGSASNSGNAYSVKCFGIENLWGNVWEWMNGLCILSSTTLGLKGTAPYNDTGSGYASVTDGYTRNSGLCPTNMISVLGGAGMVASSGQSDFTKGFCDCWNVYSTSGYVPYVGGYWSCNWYYVGPFFCDVANVPSYSGSVVGARVLCA